MMWFSINTKSFEHKHLIYHLPCKGNNLELVWSRGRRVFLFHGFSLFFPVKRMNPTLILIRKRSMKPAGSASNNVKFPCNVIILSFWPDIRKRGIRWEETFIMPDSLDTIFPTLSRDTLIALVIQFIINLLSSTTINVFLDAGSCMSFKTLHYPLIFSYPL